MPTISAMAQTAGKIAVPPQLESARDALFEDADRHGPRWPQVARQVVPAYVGFVALLLLGTVEGWRQFLIDHCSTELGDAVLVVPVAVGLVLLGCTLAPLARIATTTLLGAGIMLVGAGALLVRDGQLVLATALSAPGMLLLGVAAARGVRRTVWTVPILVAAGISDAQSVQNGLTNRLLEQDPGIGGAPEATAVAVTSVPPELVTRVDLLVLHVPALSGTWLLGLVDVLAIGLLFGLAHVYWQPLWRSVVALCGALVVAVALGDVVPVLPLIGVAWMLAHARLVWSAVRFSLRRLTYLGG